MRGLIVAAFSTFIGVFVGCGSGYGPKDVVGRNRGERAAKTDAGVVAALAARSKDAPAVSVGTTAPRVLAKASARAIKVDGAMLYYGDIDNDGVYAVPVAGGATTRIARHAPTAGSLIVGGGVITWIASPGDAVLQTGVKGTSQPTVLRSQGMFGDVASIDDDVYLAEALGTGGALFRSRGTTTSRLADFVGTPRTLLVDSTHVFVLTPTTLLRGARSASVLETVGVGSQFRYAVADKDFVYVVAAIDNTHGILRIEKAGGPALTLARDVREAPIEVEGGEVFFVDATRPQLRSVRTTGGDSRVIVEHEVLESVAAIDVDSANVYLAAGTGDTSSLVAIPRTLTAR
jgi:hypothetical protein